MVANTSIEWATHTFNPWEGCQKVGPGCDHCYAEARNARFGGGVAPNWGPGAPRRRTSPSNWAQPLRWNAAAVRDGVRPRVFCASLADVFDNAVPSEWRYDLFALIAATPRLDWLLLTKRIGNVENMLLVPFDFERLYPNVWIGATVVDQVEADRDVPKLLATPAAKRFLSIEPMLGPVDISWTEVCVPSLDWIICGGESGPGARPMQPAWARGVRDQCAAAGVPFLFKQWGEWSRADPAPSGTAGKYAIAASPSHDGRPVLPVDTYPRMFDLFGGSTVMERVGKKAAGRLLDGVQHDAVPA